MEHAARAVAALAALLLPRPSDRVLVLCGPGSNGGDGYGAARALHAWGRDVGVLRLGPVPRAEAARREHDLCAHALPIEDGSADAALVARAVERAQLVIDALFGVGLDRPLAPHHVEAIERVNAAGGLRLSVDVPSGLDADRGVPLPVCVAADVTATMAAPKAGFGAGAPGARWAGHVVEVDIGLAWALHAPYLRA
jgi:NAD(P)H-hydrate epimerase